MPTPFLPGPARARIPARTLLDQEAVQRLRAAGTLVLDDRRRRPLYFDGRFLAARDLTREQQYVLVRQADLGRAGGTGVVAGLEVTAEEDGNVLRVAPGHGVTPTGEAVVLGAPLVLRLSELPQVTLLDAAFGIRRLPAEPPRARTGLYLVVLRPVEFSANPIASYPTSVTGARGVEDGDIVEGVAATLVPFPDPGGDGELARRRARVAHTLFVERSVRGLPEDALPLAMVALERNVARWLDVDLVRREAGAAHADRFGLGTVSRALREAYLLQYDAQLADVLAERDATNRGRRFAASEHFLALPPGGRMPAAALNAADFTQQYFPADVRVDLSILPEDEVPALVEESLRLPPIDLTLDGDALGSTSVLVLLPVPAPRVRALRAALERLTRVLPPSAPNLVARRRPIELLRDLTLPRLALPALNAAAPADAAWRAELAAAAASDDGLLWYVRRRNVDYRSDLAGQPVALGGDEEAVDRGLAERIDALGLATRMRALRKAGTTLAGAEVTRVLASRAITESPLLLKAALAELEGRAGPAPDTPDAPDAPETKPALDRSTVLKVGERFAAPNLGEGLKRLQAVAPEALEETRLQNAVVSAGLAPELDRAASGLTDAQLGALAGSLAEAGGSAEKVRVVVDAALRDAAAGTLAAGRAGRLTGGRTGGLNGGLTGGLGRRVGP